MPSIYNVKYDIIANAVADTDFTIASGGQVFYYGHTYTNQVNIAPILQDFLNSEIINVSDQNLPIIEKNVLVKNFVFNNNNLNQTFYVTNNYNCHWEQISNEDALVSDIVGNYIHPEQLIFVDAVSPNGTGVINISGTDYTVNNNTNVTVNAEGILSLNYLGSINFRQASFYASIYDEDRKKFLFAGGGGYIYWYDRITNEIEEIRPELNAETYYGVAKLNGVYVLTNSNYILRSTDGYTWSRVNIINGQRVKVINGYFYAFGGNNTVGGVLLRSTDGLNWENINNTISGFILSIEYGNNMWIFCCTSAYYYSYDLLTFTRSTILGYSLGQEVLYRNGIFVIVQNNRRQLYSSDGLNWETFNSRDDIGYYCLSYGLGYFVSAFNTLWLSGRNGSDFVEGGLDSNYQIQTISFDGEYFVGGSISGGGAQGGSIVIFGNTFTPTEISFNGDPIEINLSNGCERYAIYFVNPRGGRSTYLVTAKRIIDGVSNDWFRIKTNFDRLDSKSFETRTIRNLVTKTHQFNTGWLSDEDNEKINELVTSPRVWIHDFETGEIKSAYVSQSNHQTKRFSNDRVSNSTITIYEAQEHLRR